MSLRASLGPAARAPCPAGGAESGAARAELGGEESLPEGAAAEGPGALLDARGVFFGKFETVGRVGG